MFLLISRLLDLIFRRRVLLRGPLQLDCAHLTAAAEIGDTDAEQFSQGRNDAREEREHYHSSLWHGRYRKEEEGGNGGFTKAQAAGGDEGDETEIPGDSIDADAYRKNIKRGSG